MTNGIEPFVSCQEQHTRCHQMSARCERLSRCFSLWCGRSTFVCLLSLCPCCCCLTGVSLITKTRKCILQQSSVNCQDQCVRMRVSMQNASSPWLLFEGGGFENAHACCIRQRFGMSCSLHDGSRYLSLSKQLPHGDSHLNIQSIKKTARACWHMRSGSL